MVHLHKKARKGRRHYNIREIARVDGKPKVFSQMYLGSVERIPWMTTGAQAELERLQVQEFGALWLANLIEQEFGLVEVIEAALPRGKKEAGPPDGEYYLQAAFNRMIDACSKRGMPEWYTSP